MYEDPTAQFFTEIDLHHIMEAVHSRLGDRSLRILELGCGHGRLAIMLAKRGYNVVAVDSNEVALGRARQHASHEGVSIDFQEADVMTSSFGKYDVVIAVQLLQGKEKEVDAFIQHVSGSILPRGLLVLEFRSRYIQTAICLKRGDFEGAVAVGKGDDRWLEPADLGHMLESNGYEVIDVSGIGIVSGSKFDELGHFPNPSKLTESDRAILQSLELEFSSIKELSGCGRSILAIAQRSA
jgi:2-polyprenyl-3-methyl-5-hydroxy-6-metoxy-1,4-benzoquinol methylase